MGQDDGQKVDPEVMKKAAATCGCGELHIETKDDGGPGSGPRTGSSGGSK